MCKGCTHVIVILNILVNNWINDGRIVRFSLCSWRTCANNYTADVSKYSKMFLVSLFADVFCVKNDEMMCVCRGVGGGVGFSKRFTANESRSTKGGCCVTEGQSSDLGVFMCVQEKYKLHDAGILNPDDRTSSSWAVLDSCSLYEQN